jgi:putative addiction module killer protein
VVITPKEVLVFRTDEGRTPFDEWLDELGDQNAVARILARLARVRMGNLGDCKSLGGGVSEMRVDLVPVTGYILVGKDKRLLFCCAEAINARRTRTFSARKFTGRIIISKNDL